jgi:hypothetical protein
MKNIEINFNSLDATIKKLRALINDSNSHRMNLSTVIGYLGELIVLGKLHNEGIVCSMRANQSGYDIECSEEDWQIDVKASRYKDEFIRQVGCANWGWALKHKNKIKPITCSHFVCVQFNERLEAMSYYVIPVRKYKSFPHGVGRFAGVENAFVILSSKGSEDYDEAYKNLFEKSINLLHNKKCVRKVGRDQSLSKALGMI